MSSQDTTPSIVDDGSESDLTPLTDSDFSDSDDSDFEIKPRPSKKRRVTTSKEKKKDPGKAPPKKRRGYKGALQEIWALPMDVTYEIFGHLRPLDLLQLSRTNKTLRRTLMSPASTSVWIKTRANIEGMPDCPPDMSEPGYASLMFEAYCHYCFATNVQTIIWGARLRCCKRCGTVMYAHWVTLTNADVPDVLRCIVPSTHAFTTGTVYPHTERKYSIEHATILSERMNTLSDEDKALWFWNKKLEFDRIAEHSQLCRTFILSRHLDRYVELDEARVRRTNAIISRLKAAGWGDEMNRMPDGALTDHKQFKIPKDLTGRAWQKIEHELTLFMEDTRAKRLSRERSNAISTRCNLMKKMYANLVASQPLHSILPGVADFATMPVFKAMLENPALDIPVTVNDFNLGNDKLLEFAAHWREEQDKLLVDILRRSSLGTSASKETLRRATTLFSCQTCSVPISYPRVLVHTCKVSFKTTDLDPSNVFQHLRGEPLNLGGDRIIFHEAAHKRAKHILKALGLGQDASVETLTELNPFVECLCALCYRPTVMRTYARWNRMIEHTPRYTTAHVSRPYAIVEGCRTARVTKLETAELLKLRRDHNWDDYSHRSFCCMVCKARDSRQNTERHLIERHSIATPIFGTDYTYHIDAKLKLLAPFINLKHTPKAAKATTEASTTTSAAQGDATPPASITPPSSNAVPQPAAGSSTGSNTSAPGEGDPSVPEAGPSNFTLTEQTITESQDTTVDTGTEPTTT